MKPELNEILLEITKNAKAVKAEPIFKLVNVKNNGCQVEATDKYRLLRIDLDAPFLADGFYELVKSDKTWHYLPKTNETGYNWPNLDHLISPESRFVHKLETGSDVAGLASYALALYGADQLTEKTGEFHFFNFNFIVSAFKKLLPLCSEITFSHSAGTQPLKFECYFDEGKATYAVMPIRCNN